MDIYVSYVNLLNYKQCIITLKVNKVFYVEHNLHGPLYIALCIQFFHHPLVIISSTLPLSFFMFYLIPILAAPYLRQRQRGLNQQYVCVSLRWGYEKGCDGQGIIMKKGE